MSLEINNIYIVLGNKLKENSKISTTLRKRLDKCIEKYKKKDLVIVSGGNIAKQKHRSLCNEELFNGKGKNS